MSESEFRQRLSVIESQLEDASKEKDIADNLHEIGVEVEVQTRRAYCQGQVDGLELALSAFRGAA